MTAERIDAPAQEPDERIAHIGDTVECHGRGWNGWQATVIAIRPDVTTGRVTWSSGTYRLRLTHAPTWGTDAADSPDPYVWGPIMLWHLLTQALAAPAHVPIPDAEQEALW